jgi:transcriptional regulator with XRE-family HTH domain
MGNTGLSKAFGRVLRELRLSKKLTQEELADLAQFDRTFIGLLERGERSASLDTVFKLADVLGISSNRFIAKVEAVIRES